MSEITILDGGLGQELVARHPGKPTGLWASQVMMEAPELVRGVHDDYFTAGADVATTNTYAIHHDRLLEAGIDDQFAALHRAACEMAVAARDANGAGLVAGSLGPLGWSYRPDLAPPPEQAADLYLEICRLHEPYVDIFLCETMCSVDQARGALAGSQVLDKPVWLALSVDDADGARLRSGEALVDILPLLDAMNPAAVLINCSVPEALDTAIPLLAGGAIPVGGYANGFVNIDASFTEKNSSVDALSAREDLDPAQYANFAQHWVDAGATIIGGCCEVGPAHIAELVNRFRK
jgi:S-methylmethionine-dependent homocysteine/selenocysteine methylase